MSEQLARGLGAEVAQAVNPAAFLLHVDERAQAIREMEVLLEQDEAAEDLRHQRVKARHAEREAGLAGQRESLRREIDAHRRVLLPGLTRHRTLPCGLEVGFTAVPEGVEVVDEAAFMAWAENNCRALIRRPPPPPSRPAKRALAVYFADTGEVPPGCEHRPAGERFDFRGTKGAPNATPGEG